MSMGEIREGLAMMHAGYAIVAAASMDPLTKDEHLEFNDEWETLTRQMPTQTHRSLAKLQTETTARALGAKSWRDVLKIRWRLSATEANRRLAEAAELGPRRSLTGESLDPELPATAAAQAQGLINAEHVTVIRKAIKKLPGFVDACARAQIEVDWVRMAVGAGPKDLEDAVDLALFLLDQDGPEPDDTERQRKRGLSKGKQGRDAMTPIQGQLTPEAWATLEAIFAKYAAPGMCNPDDPEPCTSGTPSQAQIDGDHRSLAQRQHDALIVIGRIALMTDLGQLNGLPVAIIIRTTLQDLEARAGVGVTGGGTRMPIADVIRLAGHANHYLAVFDKATGSAMDLFRARRTASPAQRLMLIGRDGGCTKPGCTVGGYGSQVHHAAADWADDGQTNVDDMGLACGCDNRMVDKNGGWTTRMNDRHDVEWIPPPHLDTGQTRINYHHRPETLLRPPDDAEPHDDTTDAPQSDTATDEPAEPEPTADSDSPETTPEPEPKPEPEDPRRCDEPETADCAPAEPIREDGYPEAEPFDPWDHLDVDDPTAPPPAEPISDGDCPETEPFDPWRRDEPEPNVDSGCPEADPFDPWDHLDIDQPAESPPVEPTGEDGSPEPEPFDPLDGRADDAAADEPGAPAPPDGQAV